MRNTFLLILLLCTQYMWAQINTFPYNQGFEAAFTTGTNVEFITNWTGNEVASSNRIFQGSDARTGIASLNIIPIGSFDGEVLIALNLTGINNPKVTFYAYSKQNGAVSSTRPVLLNFATSIDGGNNYLDNVAIGDDTTFPNDNTTSYTQYEYVLPASASGEANVIVRFQALYGSGSGSAAELVMDDFSIEEQIIPLAISSVSATDANTVEVTFNQEVEQTSAETAGNYAINNGISVSSASKTSANVVTLTTSTLTNNNYQLTINNVEDAATNTPAVNLQDNFTYAVTLSIESITVQDKNTLLVDFNLNLDETSAETIGNYSVDNAIGNPSTATLGAVNTDQVTLVFATDLGDNTYSLTVNGVNDQSTLVSASNLSDNFTYLPLAITSTTANSATEVVVVFNQDVEQTTAETLTNSSIDNGISVSSATRTASNEVTLSTSSMSNNNYQLTINNIQNISGNSTASALQDNFSYVVPIAIENITVQDKNSLLVDFNLDVEQSSAETIGNYSVDNAIGTPTSATRSATNNDQVTLVFASDLADNTYALTVNGVTDVSTLTTASNLSDNFSYLPLILEGVSVTSSTTIQLDFNQDLETSSAETEANYSINFGRGNPTSAVQSGTDASIVTLTLAQALVNNTYEVTINNVANTSGNAVTSNLTTDAQYSVATATRQIVINEIFADPSGANEPNPVVLPNSTSEEFVELFNTTTEAIDLTGFELSGGTIGSFVLNGGDYVILTSSGNVAAYQGFGDVVAVSSWNTLTNGGEQLILRDNLGNQVDSLTYDLSWYQDDNKSDGGWSLEQINPELVCSDGNNWIASTSAQGGTPGAQNSVYDNSPDITGPSITDVTINSDLELVVTFDEIIDEGSLAGANFTLTGGVNIANASLNLPYGRSITLSLNPAMTSGTIYTLNITGLTDCAGNTIVGGNFDFLFDDEAPVLQRLVFKTPDQIDMIFDEELNEGLAETEANFSINQGIGNPNRNTLNNTVRNRLTLELANSLTEGSVYSLTYQNLTDTLGNTIALSTENFGFQNQLDTIIVVSSQLLDIYFDENVDEPSAEIVANYVADDGLGSPVSAAVDGINPKLVHLVFGTAFPENTTTEIQFENIQDASLNYLQLLNTNFTYDTDDPDVDSVVVVDENTLHVYFDEILDETSAETINNYSANNSIGTPAQAILQPSGTSVILNFSVNFEQEVQNRLTLTAVEDLSGNAISTNRNFDFTFDRLPPRLIGVELLSPKVLAVEFSEEVVQAIAENVNNYSVNNGIGNPIQAVRTEKNTKIVELTFADLGNFAVNTLTISNVTDLFDNDLVVNLTANFSSLTPAFGQFTVLSDTRLQIQFTKELTKASAEKISNYGFDRGLGPFSLVQDATDASIVTLVLTTKLEENINYRLVINNLQDLDGNIVPPTTFDFTYNDLITQISLLNANTLQIEFEVELNETLAETVTNFSLNKGLGNPLTAVLNSADATEVTLFFDQALTESQTFELSIQNLTDIYGDIIPASRSTFLYDVTPPTITAINSTYNNEIDVIFNEPVDRATGRSLNHYSLNNGIGQPISIALSTDARTATLRFATSLVDGLAYTLTVDRVEDLQGKAINAATFDFTFESPISPAFRDIVISEIYFDTHFSSGIPNYEFVEIFNRGSEAIELRDFAITDKRDTAYLTSFVLQPNAYLTISTQAGRLNFQNYGNAIGVNSFPSLSNTGETVVFLDRDLNIVDSLQYSKAFYNDNAKEDGGWTVELINPNKACFDVTNYAASTNVDGGTPGQQNSVYDITADVTAPSVNSLTVLSNTQLRLVFSESMDIGTLDPANFGLQGGINVSSVTLENNFGTTILLNLDAAFQTGFTRTLDLSNIQDCSGNVLATQETFLLGSTPTASELLVTEIMATPAPTNGLPEREYFEIYNNSSEVMNLGNVIFKDDNGTYRLSSFNLQPNDYIIITSTSSAPLFAAYGNVMGVNSFPTFTVEDRVRLENSSAELIFEVNYDKSFYQNDAKDDGGFSMEMINLNPSCFDDANWTVSTSAVGGTPGAQNSVFDNSADNTAPSVLSFTVVSSSILELEFSESMNVASLNAGNFVLSASLDISTITQTEAFGKKTRITLTTPFTSGILYTLTLSNISDCAGNALPETTFEFSRGATPAPSQLIITEIMAAPTPAQGLPEVEYLEILNVSNQILDLNGVILADATTSTKLSAMTIQPGEYVLLAPSSTASLLNGYGKVLPVANWPSLNNSGDRSALFTPNSVEIHSVNYSDSWYGASSKSNGGYSLEMIDTDYPCVEGANWRGSDHADGGTPGATNSVDGDNPDLSGPVITQAVAVTNSLVEITFSEKLNPSTAVLANFSSDNGLSFLSAQLDATKRKVTLTTASDLVPNTLYSITANNVTDCTGNLIQSSDKTVALIIEGVAQPKDILVNEILFNPASGGERFVEFYNNSNKYINLKGWKIAGLTNTRVITEDNYFIHPNSYFVITADGANIKSQYPMAVESTFIEISSMPSLPSDAGTVFIYNLTNTEIDRFEYSEDYHSTLLDDPNGVSLERILFSGESNDPNNWFSASATENGATPGYENSQSREPQSEQAAIRIDPPTFAPDIAGASNFTTLNYAFDDPGNTLNIRIVDAEGRVVKRISQNTVVGTEGFFTWDGSTEEGGKARVGYYMIIMEVISTEGKISYIREKVAVGSRL